MISTLTLHIRRHSVAVAALFLALSGTAVAAGKIGSKDLAPSAVKTKHIADGQVKQADLGDAAVTARALGFDSVNAAVIENESVDTTDIAPDSVKASEIGVEAVGASELKGATAVHGFPVDIAGGNARTATVTCPADTRLIAGGHAWRDAEMTTIMESAPSEADPSHTWFVRGIVPPPATDSNRLYAWATCL